MKKKLIVCLICFFIAKVCSVESFQSIEVVDELVKPCFNISNKNASQQEPIEFVYKDDELKEMDKWKYKTFEAMFEDAMQCDRAALYMLGMSFLTGGGGVTIDTDVADFCFARSASFGFGPSIKQVLHKTIEDENITLGLVYINLLTSFGHGEYVILYHQYRSKLLEVFGEGVCKEVERMASFKRDLISNNIKLLEKTKDRNKFLMELSDSKKLITSEDPCLGAQYWNRFSKFHQQDNELVKKFENLIRIDFLELHQLYGKSKNNLSVALNSLDGDELINETIMDMRFNALKDANKAISKAKDFLILMEEFKNCSNEKIKIIAKEFFLLCQNVNGVLEQHYNFFLSSKEFLSSDTGVNKLTEYSAGVELYSENIEVFFEKLSAPI